MINEHGKEMTEKEILKEALNLMGEVCCLLFETESDQAKASAFMADSLIKYLQVIVRDDDVLLAAADYSAYEEEACVDALI
jgi:hypothetical protein